MQAFLKKYSRECRAAMMLLLVYSAHLFAFHSLVFSSSHYFLKSCSNKAADKKPSRSTDCFMLLAKHQLNKQKDESREEVSLPPVKTASLLRKPVIKCISFLSNQLLSPESYKLYQRHGVLLI
jgi:hypothetical protein